MLKYIWVSDLMGKNAIVDNHPFCVIALVENFNSYGVLSFNNSNLILLRIDNTR